MIQTWSSFSLVDPCSIFFHGWEIAVILRNFRKPNFQNQIFFIYFFYSISTCIQCAIRRLSLCDIRKYRFLAFYGTSPAKPPSSSAHAGYKHQSLEFVAETRILAKMKIENRGNFFFSAENKFTSILCFLNSLSV